MSFDLKQELNLEERARYFDKLPLPKLMEELKYYKDVHSFYSKIYSCCKEAAENRIGVDNVGKISLYNRSAK